MYQASNVALLLSNGQIIDNYEFCMTVPKEFCP